jgi:hypothetical protein
MGFRARPTLRPLVATNFAGIILEQLHIRNFVTKTWKAGEPGERYALARKTDSPRVFWICDALKADIVSIMKKVKLCLC